MGDTDSALPSGTHILDSLTDAVFWLDPDWRFRYLNPAAVRTLRQSRDRLMGRTIWAAYPGMVGSVFEREYRRAVSDQITVVFEAYYEPFNGWYEVRLYPSPAGLTAFIHEISDRKKNELLVTAAEAHYRRLVTRMPMAVYALDHEGRFTEANPAAERLLGRPASELFGVSYERVVAPDSVADVRAAFASVAEGRFEETGIEARIVHSAGDERLVAITATSIREDGRFVGVHGVARDITDERAAQAALGERQRLLQQVLEALPVGVSLVDLTGQQIWHNPTLDRIWGSARPVGPDRYRAYVGWAADSAARLPEHEWPIVRALRGEAVSLERIDIQAFDGTRKSTIVSAVPLRNSAGVITGALAVQEDVTAVQAMEARQRLLATVFDGLREGVCVLTPSGHALYANATFAEVLGLDPANIPGLHPNDLSATSEAVRLFPVMQRTALDTGRWAGRATHERPDGTVVTLDIVLSVVRAPGSDDLLFGIVQDASGEILREQQLRRAERLASIGTLAAGVAHELNNPLQAILSFVQMLRLGQDRPADGDTLAIMQREVERMAKIVADLKQVARSTQDRPAPKVGVDLNEVVRHVTRMQAYRLRTANIELTEALSDDLLPILADRGQVEQVVLNLLVNAIHALAVTPSGGRLTVATAPSPRGVTLEVIDEGTGIAREHVERIFDPFFTTKPPGEGTGLGLSVVHSIVAEHGGDIAVESDPGVGTSMRVDWPAALGAPHAAAAVPSAPAAPKPVSRRVLVVDDEPAIRMVLVQYLEQRRHDVHAASDGAAALRLLATHEYDVILSDLRMPGLGGEALLQRMRELGLAGRVVFMTGDPTSSGDWSDKDGIELLAKPMTLEDVARVVER
ncbi:MAG TPA: PAS domain-containing protein [Luteitalea sp.]|nr:PAS domain-containing protein [Luteitalea sp.]